MTLLWRRGDELETALARLRAIEVDPAAGRAERHAMLPQFEGLDRWLPRYLREHFVAAVDAGAISIERLVLPDAEVTHSLACEHLQQRWSAASPLYRAGRAVFANLISRGIDPALVNLHGRRAGPAATPYFAGFSLRYIRGMQQCLVEYGGKEWIAVVHPTARGPINALRIRPASIARLVQLAWLKD